MIDTPSPNFGERLLPVTLLVVWLVCALRGGRMVIDWHNFGYTVLGHALGAAHPLVAVSRAYERCLARRAGAHSLAVILRKARLLEVAIRARGARRCRSAQPARRLLGLGVASGGECRGSRLSTRGPRIFRSEEHTAELQPRP